MLTRLYRRDRLRPREEQCYYVDGPELSKEDRQKLYDLLGVDEPGISVSERSIHRHRDVIEIGPRLPIETKFSSDATGILRDIGINVKRVERSIRYIADRKTPADAIVALACDVMTQEVYPRGGLRRFVSRETPTTPPDIDILGRGEEALREVNKTYGLGMDGFDITLYTNLFMRMGRNMTHAEALILGNMNSEHCRHWHWNAIQTLDGVVYEESLFDIVKDPWRKRPGKTITAFRDNAGVIEGNDTLWFAPANPGRPSTYIVHRVILHILATAETHNHPTLISPYQGALTGAGGRIRDTRAVGRGATSHVGVAGYCVGGIKLPGYAIPGDLTELPAEYGTASPLEILMQGINGVHAYGNEYGEPLIGGFTRSFEMMVAGRLVAFRKPVLYSGGLGSILAEHVEKRPLEAGMLIIRLGGKAYSVGVGGGSASSLDHGSQKAELDFKSVQRGDAQTKNKVNRVIEACVAYRSANPIVTITDQGASGIANWFLELLESLGGRADIRKVTRGDSSMPDCDVLIAEFQESYGLVIKEESLPLFLEICKREDVPCDVLGHVTGDGRVVMFDSEKGQTHVDLLLADVLGKMPRKPFTDNAVPFEGTPFVAPSGSLYEHWDRVSRRIEVALKHFITSHVDRSVGGLVVGKGQQCQGPFQLPVGNVGIKADGYFTHTGAAEALGEQPIKGLINSAAGARMAVWEMMQNLAAVLVASIDSINCRANWMWPKSMPGEGVRLYRAALAMRDIMIKLRIRANGGKDSLSMVTTIKGQRVASPGQLVIMGYAPVRDIRKVVTPDLKAVPSEVRHIGFIDIGQGKNRLSASQLAVSYGQLGNETPDIDDIDLALRAWLAIQAMIRAGVISAYHDRSDGGLLTMFAEMCIAGNCGARIRFPAGTTHDLVALLFAEEGGMAFEYTDANEAEVMRILKEHDVPLAPFTATSCGDWEHLSIGSGDEIAFTRTISELRADLTRTSLAIESHVGVPQLVREERAANATMQPIAYCRTFVPEAPALIDSPRTVKVGVLRTYGTNGDREMAAALKTAQLEPVDVAMSDILRGTFTSADFDSLRGMVACGGFGDADTFGAAKGWAARIRYNGMVKTQFDRFYERPDTITLGVCNGAQLFTHIGWAPDVTVSEKRRPMLIQNASQRFESRWVATRVMQSPAKHLAGMHGSVLGVYISSGEGQFHFRDKQVLKDVLEKRLVALSYVGPNGEPTGTYPYNPNGSPHGMAALTTADGRHLSMMPHAERSFLPWQWPWVPHEWREDFHVSPWLQLFTNMKNWALHG